MITHQLAEPLVRCFTAIDFVAMSCSDLCVGQAGVKSRDAALSFSVASAGHGGDVAPEQYRVTPSCSDYH